ncbi:restriction endonuclease subunit S [Gulosibacter hominis]|uniref:restriction endonuclease subunit S n=1 Tax=Gulosibacter hominis TaxID=2770504 RepID=UPI001917D290|nr:restriction endonuclease subunit S [Gulosibacter hominis]
MKTTLGQIVVAEGIKTGPFGSQLHASEYSPSGVGVVMPQDIRDNALSFEAMAHITNERAHELSGFALAPGDIVQSRRGDISRRAIVHADNPPLICGTGCLRIRIDNDLAHPRFVFYLLATAESSSWLLRHSVGATMPNLNASILGKLPVELPPLNEQQAIAEVLGALDDRIAANKAVVELCDQLRHTYWKQLTTKATTEQPLSELAQFVNGRAFTKNADGKGRMVVRIAELNTGPGASTVYSSIDAPENHTVSAGELLMSWSGSLRTARWFRDDAIVNQHIFKVIPTAPDTEWAVESAIDTLMPTFRSIAADKATTMGHIKREHLDFKVRWPRLTGGQQALGASVWRRALQAEVENEVLARTRDELLPLLMNGTITVREAEDRTKEVP